MKLPTARISGMWLGGIYLALGVAEVLTHRDGSAAELLFWGGSLLGGGALVLAGLVIQPRHPPAGLTLLTVGVVLGINATLWTLLLPVAAVVVLVRSYRVQDAGLTTWESPQEAARPD